MPVRLVVGENLFRSSAQTLVNTVNTVGVMGKGLAKKFADRYPDMLADYEARCLEGAEERLVLGQPYLYRRPELPWILNFPTKEHWRSGSRLAPILAGLDYLREHLREWQIESLAVPPLGCGHGGLEWRAVGQLYVDVLDAFGIQVMLYAPFEVPWIRGSSEPLSLFPDAIGSVAPSPPRSSVPLAWIEFSALLAARRETTVLSRSQLAQVALDATREGLETGLLLDASKRDGVVGLTGILDKMIANGLLEHHQQPRPSSFSAGHAALSLVDSCADEHSSMLVFLARALEDSEPRGE